MFYKQCSARVSRNPFVIKWDIHTEAIHLQVLMGMLLEIKFRT